MKTKTVFSSGENNSYFNATGNGSTINYPLQFDTPVDEDFDLFVWVDGELLVRNVDYYQFPTFVVFARGAGYPAKGAQIYIARETTITQLRDFKPFGTFMASKTEGALDKLILIKQEANEWRGKMNLGATQTPDRVIINNDKGTNAELLVWKNNVAGMWNGTVREGNLPPRNSIDGVENGVFMSWDTPAPPPLGPSKVSRFLSILNGRMYAATADYENKTFLTGPLFDGEIMRYYYSSGGPTSPEVLSEPYGNNFSASQDAFLAVAPNGDPMTASRYTSVATVPGATTSRFYGRLYLRQSPGTCDEPYIVPETGSMWALPRGRLRDENGQLSEPFFDGDTPGATRDPYWPFTERGLISRLTTHPERYVLFGGVDNEGNPYGYEEEQGGHDSIVMAGWEDSLLGPDISGVPSIRFDGNDSSFGRLFENIIAAYYMNSTDDPDTLDYVVLLTGPTYENTDTRSDVPDAPNGRLVFLNFADDGSDILLRDYIDLPPKAPGDTRREAWDPSQVAVDTARSVIIVGQSLGSTPWFHRTEYDYNLGGANPWTELSPSYTRGLELPRFQASNGAWLALCRYDNELDIYDDDLNVIAQDVGWEARGLATRYGAVTCPDHRSEGWVCYMPQSGGGTRNPKAVRYNPENPDPLELFESGSAGPYLDDEVPVIPFRSDHPFFTAEQYPWTSIPAAAPDSFGDPVVWVDAADFNRMENADGSLAGPLGQPDGDPDTFYCYQMPNGRYYSCDQINAPFGKINKAVTVNELPAISGQLWPLKSEYDGASRIFDRLPLGPLTYFCVWTGLRDGTPAYSRASILELRAPGDGFDPDDVYTVECPDSSSTGRWPLSRRTDQNESYVGAVPARPRPNDQNVEAPHITGMVLEGGDAQPRGMFDLFRFNGAIDKERPFPPVAGEGLSATLNWIENVEMTSSMLHEVVIIPRALTDTEFLAVYRWLHDKWIDETRLSGYCSLG